MKIIQIQINTGYTDHIEIRAKIRRKWYERTISVGHAVSDCSIDKYYPGEVSIGFDLSNQSMNDGFISVPVRILCVPREGKHWSHPTAWGVHDQSRKQYGQTTIIEGLVSFNTNTNE